ncbi:hypothetical protein ISN45_At01g056950 [Arabidopsis thaliana x Arabidopsis arenosa]|uniref:Uncharacterized protein n=2 Tax=Arabidopsis TaxID=3701 RepID=A0A8T2HDR2_ARASU|nr:hypothetical protein ISN45_At01g056950 [Arabidopsis thaliana x Arabidopsis arenosa]KAG7658631.1 hypothetical protein ISN44_As01g055980 [Arabidopsis suecica]
MRSHNSTIEQGPSFVFVFPTVEPPLVERTSKENKVERDFVGRSTHKF